MAKQSKGAKVGRSKRNGQNDRYKLEHRHEKSHFARLVKHFLSGRAGLDTMSAASLMHYAVIVGKVAYAKELLGRVALGNVDQNQREYDIHMYNAKAGTNKAKRLAADSEKQYRNNVAKAHNFNIRHNRVIDLNEVARVVVGAMA